jgi:hypothetical protein
MEPQTQITPWYQSSTGEGVSMRIKSSIALVIPVLNLILKGYGVELVPDSINEIVDAVFLIIFSILQVYGWARRNFFKAQGMGKFAK